MSFGVFKKGKGRFGTGQDNQVQKEDIHIIKVPTSTADLINDGADGSHPFISANDLLDNSQNSIMSGNGITWLYDYTYEVSEHRYSIRGEIYTAPKQEVTLSPPDATFDRIDVIVGTFNTLEEGLFFVLEGIPATTPIKPVVYDETQIEITSITVATGTVAPPDISNTVVYEDNTEFATSDNTGGKVVWNSADDPASGTVCIKVTDFTTGNQMYFEDSGTFFPYSYGSFSFRIIPQDISGWINEGTIQVAFFRDDQIASDWVIIDSSLTNAAGNPFAFDSKTTQWQLISIPTTAFNLAITEVNKIVFQKADNKGGVDFRMDILQLQQGVSSGTGIEKTKLSQFINDGNGDPADPFATKSEIQAGITDVNAGTGIVIDKTDPLEPLISAIPQSTAGFFRFTYFTGDLEVTGFDTFFKATPLDKGTVVTATQSVTVNDNQTLFYTTDLLGDLQSEDVMVQAGDYTGELSVSSNGSGAQYRFDVEVYIANADGSVTQDSGVSGLPVGDLGFVPLAYLSTGNSDLPTNDEVNRTFSGSLIEAVTVLANTRTRYHISCTKVGTSGGSEPIVLYYGNQHGGYVAVPVPLTTDGIMNKSDVEGVTTTESLNWLKANSGGDLQVTTDKGAITTNLMKGRNSEGDVIGTVPFTLTEWVENDLVLENTMVSNGIQIMQSLRETRDYPFVTTVGEPVFGTEDFSSEISDNSVITSGNKYNGIIENSIINAIKVHVPDIGLNTTFSVYLRIFTNVPEDGRTIIYENIPVAQGVNVIYPINREVVLAGQTAAVYLNSTNSSTNTTFTEPYIFNGYNSSQVNLTLWGLNPNRSLFKISMTNADSDYIPTLINSVTPSTVITIVDDINPTDYTKWVVTSLNEPTAALTSFVGNILETSGSDFTEGTKQNLTFEIPVASGSKASVETGFWTANQPTWCASAVGELAFGGVVQSGVENNAYGIDIQVQTITKSDDWKVWSLGVEQAVPQTLQTVTENGAETNIPMTAPSFISSEYGKTERYVAAAPVAGVSTIDWVEGDAFMVDDADVALTLEFTNLPTSGRVKQISVYVKGDRPITLPSGIYISNEGVPSSTLWNQLVFEALDVTGNVVNFGTVQINILDSQTP